MESKVINYIKAATKFGLSDFEIKQNLLNAGWEAQVIEESFAHARAEETKPLQNKDEDIKFPQAGKTSALPSQQHLATRLNNITVRVAGAAKVISLQKRQPLLFNFKFWVIMLSLAVLVAGASGYYFYIYPRPQKVWQKFLAASPDSTYQTALTLKYADQLTEGDETKPFEFSISKRSYINGQKPEHTQSDNQVTIGWAAGGSEFNQDIQVRVDGDDIYLNLDHLPGFGPFFSGDSKSTSWVKLNLKQLQTDNGIDNAEYSQIINDLAYLRTEFQNELGRVWKFSNFVKLDSLVGKEEVDGVKTFHFKNSLDKPALKLAMSRTFSILQNFLTKYMRQNGQQSIGQDSLSQMSDVVNRLIDKIEVKRFETWIGANDAKLYRLELVSSGPSLSGQDATALIPGVGLARAKARDAKRLADIRQLAAALELYYNDKTGYPAATQGVPDGLEQYYLSKFPQAPVPPDGSCSQYYNTYWYEGKGRPVITNGTTLYPDYELTFCLGQETGGYKAGIAKLTPKGIESGIACPIASTNCTAEKSALTGADHTKQLIEGLNFSAEVSVNLTNANYGQTRDIDFPTDAIDLLELWSIPDSKTGMPKD